MPMTSDAKSALSSTIRSLRATILADLHTATESAYRMSLKASDAVLSEAGRIRRARLEDWIAEQVRALPKKEQKGASERFRLEVEKDAAAALLQRMVYLRLLEENGLRSPKVVVGGWESPGYKAFRELAPELVQGDETEGYAQLLQLIFDELAVDLPGLFGDVRLTNLVPVPAKTLRAVVEALDAPELASCWTDDMTLGWIYQFWNDPEREKLDARLADKGKLASHEISAKTQMFTERYMVDWLLQNSLGPMWLAMCRKHGWTPEVEADGTLTALEERRVLFRAKREASEVGLTSLMPLENDAERRWAYYVPQPIPENAVAKANDSVRDLKILDPAVGSGHFLVVAFDLLVALYQEEARHRGEEAKSMWSMNAIVERILEHNLHGIDLDPKAVQIAAAALLLKAKLTCATAHPKQLGLVATNLRLSSLPADDEAVVVFREEVERETGIPSSITRHLLEALAGADNLGSLVRVDAAIDEALTAAAEKLSSATWTQGALFGERFVEKRAEVSVDQARTTLLGRLEDFLLAHSRPDDLGLRLKGEQLAAGVRFMRMVKEGSYDLVVANPPYLGTSKLRDAQHYKKTFETAAADLYAGFFLRGLELTRTGGTCAFLSPSSWMFLKGYTALRKHLLSQDIVTVAELGKAAFSTGGTLISTAMVVFRNERNAADSTGLKTFEDYQPRRDRIQPWRTRASLIAQVGRHSFNSSSLRVVPEWPLIYWWDEELESYESQPKIGDSYLSRNGLQTNDNGRFLRASHEVRPAHWGVFLSDEPIELSLFPWVPYLKGASGRRWIEPLDDILNWKNYGLELRVLAEQYGRTLASEELYFVRGAAFTTLGATFGARLHRYRSVFGNMGRSVFGEDLPRVVCSMNRQAALTMMQAFNPSIHYTTGDVNRLVLFGDKQAGEIVNRVSLEFERHESHRELSVEFRLSGSSPWRHAQEWAQLAVDRPEGEPLPEYVEELDQEPPTENLSFGLGVAFGRFGATGEGILDPAEDGPAATLPAGICFLDGTQDASSTGDSLGHEGCALLRERWKDHGLNIDIDLRTWLRLKFFKDVHKGMYDNRPIYFPLSSEKKTFVAYVSIHRCDENTLRALLAEHLRPALVALEGEVPDLRTARQSSDKDQARDAESRFAKVSGWKEELENFITKVEQCSEKGPPPPDNKTTERKVDVRYAPDLDDGVMINSAALWPLLEPQWKDPKKWWKELANAKGRKDYDWAHLAARYFPDRVGKKCKDDPSLGVAHGCFWKYHPELAYKWELRLQDEVAQDFTIDEEGSNEYRAAFEAEYPDSVRDLVAKEQKRRDAKIKKQQKLDLDEGGSRLMPDGVALL